MTSTGPCQPLGSTCVVSEIPDGACRKAADLALAIVAGAITKLSTFWCDEAPGCQGVDGMVTHGYPFVYAGMPRGLLAVWLDDITLVSSSTPTFKEPAEFQLELWLPGFPTLTSGGATGTEFVVPPAAVRNQVGLVSTAIGHTLAHGIAAVLRERQCAVWSVEKVRPLDTGDDVKGWSTRIKADLASL